MNKKPKSVERVAAENIALDYASDTEVESIEQHVASEFEFIQPKSRIYFYRWLVHYVSLKVPRSPSPIGSSFAQSEGGSLITLSQVLTNLDGGIGQEEFVKRWKRARRNIAFRLAEKSKSFSEKKKILPVKISNGDRARFDDLKNLLDSKTNDATLVMLLDIAESLEERVKERVKQEHQKLLEKLENYKKSSITRFSARDQSKRIDRLEMALEHVIKGSFKMSVDEYLDSHRKQTNIDKGHVSLREQNPESVASVNRQDETSSCKSKIGT